MTSFILVKLYKYNYLENFFDQANKVDSPLKRKKKKLN